MSLVVFATLIAFLLVGGGVGFYCIKSLYIKCVGASTMGTVLKLEQVYNLRSSAKEFARISFVDSNNEVQYSRAFLNLSQYADLKRRLSTSEKTQYTLQLSDASNGLPLALQTPKVLSIDRAPVKVKIKYLRSYPDQTAIEEDGSETVCLAFIGILAVLCFLTYLADEYDFRKRSKLEP